MEKLEGFLPPSIINTIRSQTLEEGSDFAVWTRDPVQGFTVKSAYEVALETRGYHKQGSWNLIWKLKVPPKIQTFMWLVMHNKLLTNTARVRRGFTQDDSCSRCLHGSEDTLHLLRDCEEARAIWSRWATPSL